MRLGRRLGLARAPAAEDAHRPRGLAQRALIRRSVLGSARRRELVLPALGLPLLFLAFNGSQLGGLTRLARFPARTIDDYVVPISLLQGVVFPSVSAGLSVAQDLESGFFRRLTLSPIGRGGLLTGALAGALGIALLCQALTIAVGALLGAWPGERVVAVAVQLALVDTGFALLGAAVALLAGYAESVEVMLPVVFAVLGMAAVNVPLGLIAAGWFRTVATWNPVTYLIDGLRWGYRAQWSAHALTWGLVAAAGTAALGGLVAWIALQRQLNR